MIKILVLILLITSSFTFASSLKTRWTYEEDRALITQRLLNGTKTSEVKVEGKTPKQSCNRYNKLLIKYKSDLINYLDPSPTGVARTSPVQVETKKRKNSTASSGARKAQKKAFFPEPATVADGSLRTEPVSQIVVVSGADCLDPNAPLDTAQSNFVAPISQQPGNSQDSFIYPLGYFDGDDSLHTIPPYPFGMSPQSTFSSPVRENSINYHLLSSPFYNGLFTQPAEEQVNGMNFVPTADALFHQSSVIFPSSIEELTASRLTVGVDQSYFPTLSSPQGGISQESHWSEFSDLADISTPLSPVTRQISINSNLLSPYLIEYL
ncbi:MAG: SANT/Myb-like DNA-binding domain-containing protein [Proteobacteria bacterium]|jgi:hypothetical protein|nr:SANT/Myb-like DNA-binding domain-containing protein [Pseudomonadota bacterium]